MKNNKADLILHPVRLKIILTIMRQQQATASQLSKLLPEIPQATLYRHINKLVKADVLNIVEQHQVRGMVEKVYALSVEGANLSGSDMKHVTKDDHMRYFTTFVSTLMNDFSQYLEQPDIDMARDRVGYRQLSLYLSDDELKEVMNPLQEALQKAMPYGPEPGRKRRTISFVIIPEADNNTEEDSYT